MNEDKPGLLERIGRLGEDLANAFYHWGMMLLFLWVLAILIITVVEALKPLK